MTGYAEFTRAVERQVGSKCALALACLTVVVWAVTGPIFGWSDTWQLVINTGTTIVTFLMVFIIQSTQTRDTAAIHLKLDELIRVDKQARNSVMGIETLDDDAIERMRKTTRRSARRQSLVRHYRINHRC
jgi:low affinity Fe/Cu permease